MPLNEEIREALKARHKASLREDVQTSLREDVQAAMDKPGTPGILGKTKDAFASLKESANNLKLRMAGIDKSVDRSGVPDFEFRLSLGQMDTPSERAEYLTRRVGKEGWGKDKYGALTLTPKGQAKLGLKPKSKSVYIDEPWEVTKYDIADLGGMVGPAGGAGLGFAAAGPIGAPIGAMGGYLLQEGAEGLSGLPQHQGRRELARGALQEGVLAGAGEVATKGLAAVGRGVMAPKASAYRQRELIGAGELQQQAKEMGVTLSPGQLLTKEVAPTYARGETIVKTLAGDPVLFKNEKALTRELSRLKTISGRDVGRVQTGELVKESIEKSKDIVKEWADRAYSRIDEAARFTFTPSQLRANPFATATQVVPTTRLASTASQILDLMPKTSQGGMIADPKAINMLTKLSKIEPRITMGQLREVRSLIRDGLDNPELFPGISNHRLYKMYRATTRMFDDAASNVQRPELASMIRETNEEYFKQVDKFDTAVVKKLARHKSLAGSVDPGVVVDQFFKRRKVNDIKYVMALVPDEVKGNIRAQAMEDILAFATKGADDPLRKIFTGKSFLDALDSYSRETLDAMFGKDVVQNLYKFGRVTSASGVKVAGAGGLTAQAIAARWYRHLPTMGAAHVLARVFTSDKGVKWLTTGLEAHNTRKGAEALTRAAILGYALEKEEKGLGEDETPKDLREFIRKLDGSPMQQASPGQSPEAAPEFRTGLGQPDMSL